MSSEFLSKGQDFRTRSILVSSKSSTDQSCLSELRLRAGKESMWREKEAKAKATETI